MTYRTRNVAIAVALALVAGLLSLAYVSSYKRHVRHNEKTVAVYVAKSDIPAGTSGADIVRRHLLVQSQVIARTVVPGTISEPDQVQNLVTSEPIFAGEQVTLRRFADHEELGPRALLHGTLRAINVEGDPAQLLAGVLKAGDHVDIVATWKACGTDNCQISRNVLRNLLVLEPAGGPSGKIGSDSSSVLLAASEQRQIQKIWWTVKNSDGWSLALRPVTNATDSPEDVETAKSMAADGVGQSARNHATYGSPR